VAPKAGRDAEKQADHQHPAPDDTTRPTGSPTRGTAPAEPDPVETGPAESDPAGSRPRPVLSLVRTEPSDAHLSKTDPPGTEPGEIDPEAADVAQFGPAAAARLAELREMMAKTQNRPETKAPGRTKPARTKPGRSQRRPAAESDSDSACARLSGLDPAGDRPASSARADELRAMPSQGDPGAKPAATRRRSKPARRDTAAAQAGFEELDHEPREARRSRRRGAEKDGAAQARTEEDRDPAARAKSICLHLLTAQPRTRAELKKALLKKEISEDVAEQVLGRLDAVGLIDDKAFAEMWVRSRHTYQGMGRRALSIELKRRGVDNDTVSEVVASVDEEAEEERARQLVRKKLPGMAKADPQAKIRRLVGMLARKGYSQGLAYRVVKDELANFGDETDLLDGEGFTP
jgi:regulatory protein